MAGRANSAAVVTHTTPAAMLADCIFVQLTLASGRTLEQKRGFYKQVADELHRRLGVRREDVFINLVPVDREDWSFGNGEASLVKDK